MNKSEEFTFLVGSIIRKHIYAECLMDSLIKCFFFRRSTLNHLLEEILLSKRSFKNKIKTLKKINKNKIFIRDIKDLIQNLEYLNDIRNSLGHKQIKQPLDNTKLICWNKSFVRFRGKETILDRKFIGKLNDLSVLIKKDLDDLLREAWKD